MRGPVTTAMAMLLQQDLRSRGHYLELGDCEAVLAHVLDATARLSRRAAIAAVEMPLCPAGGATGEPS
ncbi:hypothetical protein [Bradyrhizobium sp. DOA9]|uniref:hypothetical protein n=1 Tax=Bradyrhizobium sp. DOA9 TaxID=1126627 RepID=UPI000723465A|nr:hypothetical protein [Bradyrhizobium sp. DOA9]GAJ35130.1 hypothetical protein BDOA9_0143290 [Bradyrhizobium sp. DOA9]